MNEQAIQDAYNLFVQTGYKGNVNEFSNLIKTNPNALNDSYNLFVENGYADSYDDYKTLVGVNQAQGADLLKKKGQGPMAQMVPKNTTESFVEESLSASQPKTQVAPKAQVAPKQKPGILAQPVPQNTTESFLETVSAEPSIQPIGTKPKVAEKPKQEGQGDVLNVMSSFNRGTYKGFIGEPIKALGTLLQETSGKLTGTDGKAFLSDALINFGNYFNKTIDELSPQDEEFKNSLSDQWGQAFGNVASQVLTAIATEGGSLASKGLSLAPEILSQKTALIKVLKELGSETVSPSAVSAGLTMGQSEFDRAKEMGATDDQAFEAFYKNAAVGSILEKLPVMQFLKRFNKASNGGIVDLIKTKGVAGTVGGLEEMSTEVLQQVYANKTAQEIYNTNQDLFEGVGTSGGIGFGVGFILNAMGANAKLLRKKGNNAEADLLENQITELEQQVKNGGPSSYKFNGIKMQSADVLEKMIESMDANQLAKANIEITNDPVLKAKLQDKIVSSSIKEQVKKANPDLNEPSLNAITQLELDLQKLQGNTTQSGKDKAAAIRGQIKNIQENQLQEEAATETLNAEENAIQEQSTNAEMLRSKQPELGLREVGEGDTGTTETTGTSTEIITDEKSQKIGKQLGKLFNDFTTALSPIDETATPNQQSVARRKANKADRDLTDFLGFDVRFGKEPEQQAKVNALSTLKYKVGTEFADVNEMMTAYKEDKANGVASPVVQSIDTLLGITPQVAPEVVTETVTEEVPAVSSKTQEEVTPLSTEDLKTQVNSSKNISEFLKNIITDFDTRYKNRKAAQPLVTNISVSEVDNIRPSQKVEKETVNFWKAEIEGGKKPFIIIRKNNTIDGQHKLQAYKDLGIENVPVLYENDLINFYNKTKEEVSSKTQENKAPTKKAPAKKTTAKTEPVQVDEELKSKLKEIDGLYAKMSKDKDAYGKLKDLLGVDFFADGLNEQEKEVFKSLRYFAAYLNPNNVRYKFKNISELVNAYQKAKSKGIDSELVKTIDTLIEAQTQADKGAIKVETVVEDLLDVDVSQQDGLDKVYGFLDSLDNNIKKELKKGLNDATFAIPLGIVQQIVKGLKVLVKGGMTLRDAIRSMSKETDVPQETIKDIIAISPIQEEFNALMAKVDTLIARQKAKNVDEAKIISNVDTFIRNSDVYKAADDAQKKILEREGRVKMNARERRAPSIGRVLGALQDFTNITREEKIQIIKQIRTLSQNAAKSLSKEINELASSGSITPKQVAAIINRFGKVNLLNEISVANFVDYMAKVFNDAEYADKISVAKKQLAIAKKNIETKIGKADGLMIPLRQMLAINPNLIPDSVFNEYLSLVDMFGQRRTVLTLAEKSDITKQVNNILEAVNKEQFEADNLAFVMRESNNIVYNENGTIDFAETLKKMVKEEEITQEDADLMRKYKSEILPQVEPEPKSDKEIEAEKQDLLNALSKTEVQTSGLPSRDERNLANTLAKLIRTDAVKSLTNADLKNLLRVIDNINNNFLPNYASLMVGKLNGINKGKVLDNSITKAIPLAISKFASRVKSVFTGENNPAFEMIKRGPQMSIDEMLGDFKSNNVFKSLFESVSEAASTYKTEIKKIQNILEEAENKIAKSFKMNQEEITMSKYKIMTYLIQLEYESNPNNEQVNPAANYIKETIKLIQSETSQYNKEDMKKFESILKEYNDGKGGIDNKKLYDSFNPAEKSAIKDIRGINESLAEKAAFTASVLRGDKFNPLTNYVHLNVLSDTGLDESFTPEYMTRFDNSMRPSTKAKSLIERTKGAKALNFDAFASAQRGANFVLMDYNLTPAIREAHITLNQTLANLQQQANEKAREKAKKDGVTDENELNQIEGVIPQKERRIYNALKSAFELATADLLQTSSLDNSLIDDAVDYITKQGYRTTLAGTGRFAAESLSNLSAVAILDPVAYYNGVADFGKFSMNQDAATFMMNVKSKSTSRLYGSNPLSGRIVDTNILNQASGMKGAKSIGAIENRIMQSWNLTGKKAVNGIELTADALVATPDKVVSIPFWFGSFAKKFKQITGEDIDRQKVVEDDEAYMNKYEDAIREAKNFADNRATTIASTDNPYMNILKGKSKKEQTALTKAFNVFNNFLTNFNIVDFYNLRRGVYSLMGKGMLTKTEGARLMGAIATRSIIYLTLGKLFGDGILGMIGGDDDEKKEDNTWYQTLGQAIASTATSAFIGRDFGNAVRLFLNSAIEYGNEKYLDFLRTGPYDRFKDSIQFSAIPEKKGNLPLGLVDFALPLSGPLQPALKTTDFVIKTWTADEKKEAAAKERQEKNKYIRTPIEIAGNLGAILMYKDVRKLVMKDINKTLIQEQKAAADKKANKLRLLQGFETEGDMKRYEPELWDRTFGPSSEGYDARQEEKRLKREQKKLEQAIEDEERGYVPPAPKRRSGSSGFGPQEGRSKSGFGPQNRKSKSSFGPQ